MPTEQTALQPFVEHCTGRVNRALERWLPTENTHPARLHRAMRYAVLNGGKRIRPILAYATAVALDLEEATVDAASCAVELIHCYSLVHDDLPAMDDDDLRRGRPTCHKAFDEATALLVGDALQTLAFHVLAHERSNPPDSAARLRMVQALALAAGSRGMAGGQAIDLASVGKPLDLAALESMHIHKTGALIRCSVLLAALCRPGLAPALRTALDRYAKCIGLAFQIRDDILDIEGSTEKLGKHRGQDVIKDKPTYVTLLGLDAAKDKTAELYAQALASLEPFGNEANHLRRIADFVVQRDR